MSAASLLRLPRLRNDTRYEGLIAPGYPLLLGTLLGFAAAGGARVDWAAFALSAAAFVGLSAALRARGRREWLFALPLLGALPPVLAAPAPPLMWVTYTVSAVAMVVLVQPSVIYAAFLALVPVAAWGLVGELGGAHTAMGPAVFTAVLSFSSFMQFSHAVQREREPKTHADAYTRLVQLRVREPIDVELRESLGATVMAVTAQCRLALAGDAALMRERLAAADTAARWGLERLRVTSRALRPEPVEADALAGFLRNSIRGMLGRRVEISMQSDLTENLLPPEAAYGMAALVFDMLEAARVQETVATVGVYCSDAGFTIQLRRPEPEFAVAQTREWTVLRRRAARLGAAFSVETAGGRITLRVAGAWMGAERLSGR
jgi:signal transduction histidine kinase